MKLNETKTQFTSLPGSFEALCRFHPPRPIHDRIEADNMFDVVRSLSTRKLNKDQTDYFELLSRLIEDYEEEQLPPDPQVSGLESLKHLLEENRMKAADLARLLGIHRSHGAMILRGERKLTTKHLAILSKRFGITSDVFLD